MAVTCTPQALMPAAKCFVCPDAQMELAIQTYLLAVIAGVSLDPDVLMKNAACFTCLTTQQSQAIQAYLLCQIANL